MSKLTITKIIVGLSIAVGFTVMLGWYFDITTLSGLVPIEAIYHRQEATTHNLFIVAIEVLSILFLIIVAWSIAINRELSKRKKTEEVLHETLENLRGAQSVAHLGSWGLDIKTGKLTWSDEIYRIFEIERTKFGATYDAFLDAIHPDDKTAVNDAYTNSVRTKAPYAIGHRLLMKDGRIKYVHERGETFYNNEGDALRSVGTIQDITNEKKAEFAVRTSEETLRQSIDRARDAIVVMGPDKRIIFWNKASEEIFGYTGEEAIGRDLHALLASHEDQEAFARKIPHFIKTGEGPIVNRVRELVAIHKDGHHFPIELSVSSTKIGDTWVATGIVRDITARKKADEDIQKKNRALRILSNTNNALIHATDETDFLKKICEIIMEDGKYRFVWIGRTNNHDKNIKNVAQAGLDEGFIRAINETTDGYISNTLEKKALQSKNLTIIPEIKTDSPEAHTWEAEAIKRGYQSALSLPLFDGDSVFAVLTIYSTISNSFNADEVSVLQEMVDDLSFGIASLRARTEREVSEEKFSATFHASPDMIIITKISDNTIVDINESFSKALGYTRSEVIGKNADDFPVWGSLADKELIQKEIQKSGSITGFETTLLSADGRTIATLGSARTIKLSGELCVLSIIHDITARKVAEAERITSLKFMESMDKINKAILGTDDLEEMMSNVLNVVIEIMDCDRAWLLTPTEPWILSYRVPMERAKPGFPGAMSLGIEIPIDPETVLLLQKARATDGPVTFDSESDPPLPQALREHFGIQSQILMDIYPKVDESWMFGLHQCSYKRIWTDEEKRLFTEIGRRITDALTSLLSYRNLKQSEEKYSRIITTTTEGILSLDKEHNLTYINPRMLGMLGYTQKEMLGHKFEEFLISEELKDNEHQMEERKKGNATIYDRRFRRKDGTIIWCSVSGTPILDSEQGYNGSFGMVTDITERKKAEVKLIEQERYSQSLLHFSRNLEQAQTYGEALAAAQQEIETIIGYKNVWAYTISDDKKYAYSIIATGPTAPLVMSNEGVSIIPIEGDPMMEKIVSSKDIVVVEDAQTDPTVNKEIVKKIGNRTIVNVPIVLFDRNLGSVGMGTFGDEGIRVPTESEQEYLVSMSSHMAVAFDRIRLLEERIKSQKEILEANQELFKEKTKDEALLESLGEGIIAIDKQGNIVAINHAAEKIIGWKEGDILGKDIFEAVPATDENNVAIPREKRFALSVLKSKTGTETGVLRYVRRDGTTVPVAITATPFILNNEAIGAVNVFHDITKEKELEETRKDLLSLASHQLRTPLSGTRWLIETLKKGIKGPLNKGQAEYIDELYRINERMTTLVHDMLGVLRMEGGTIPSSIVQVAASKIIATEIDNLSPAAKGKNVSLRVDIHDDCILNTDQALLQQILEVFISNGITYSGEGTEVVIAFSTTKDEAIFEVRDSGIGIPKSEQAQIFQRFYRATNAKTFDTHGTGLGLYIASILAKKLGARISFESNERAGSTFSVHLPLITNPEALPSRTTNV